MNDADLLAPKGKRKKPWTAGKVRTSLGVHKCAVCERFIAAGEKRIHTGGGGGKHVHIDCAIKADIAAGITPQPVVVQADRQVDADLRSKEGKREFEKLIHTLVANQASFDRRMTKAELEIAQLRLAKGFFE